MLRASLPGTLSVSLFLDSRHDCMKVLQDFVSSTSPRRNFIGHTLVKYTKVLDGTRIVNTDTVGQERLYFCKNSDANYSIRIFIAWLFKKTLLYFSNLQPITTSRFLLIITKFYKTFMQLWRLSRNKDMDRVPGKHALSKVNFGHLHIVLSQVSDVTSREFRL